MIFNMTPATTCPSRALGLCQLNNPAFCYAMKAEKMYPKCLPHRMEQQELWESMSAEDFAELFLRERGKKNVKYLRFNESGDFINQESLNKAEEVAKLLAEKEIITYCYTARKDLDYSNVKNLVVNGSGWMRDNECDVVLFYDDLLQKECVPCPKSIGKSKEECGITCMACMQKTGKRILFLIH
jgi:hypothetical protein